MLSLNWTMVVLLATTILLHLIGQTEAFGKCDTICQSDPSCASGGCTVSRCTESGPCFQYCVSCKNVETCYGTGSDQCKYENGNLIISNSWRPTISLSTLLIGLILNKLLN